MNSMEALEIAQNIMGADWSYNYTDDYSAFLRGQASVSKVQHMIKEKEWTTDDVSLIINEVRNILSLRSVGKDFPQSTFDYWENMITRLFRRSMKNEE